LEVVEQYPVVNITAGTANTTGGASVGYTNVGVKLKVTPHISANNYVSLKVVPEVSAHEKDVSYSLGQGSMVSVPVFTTRTMETTVLIPSGNTLVMGGMLQDQIIASSTKVPVLGDIPVLGYAFHSNSKARQKTKLLIFITPTIVQDTDFQPARSDFLKTPAVQEMEPEWSAWDSGKPLDWSKLNSRGGKSEQPVFDESLVTPKAQ
jgi:general secretion pathway protein D